MANQDIKINFLGEDNCIPLHMIEQLKKIKYTPIENGIYEPVDVIENDEGWKATFSVDYYYDNHRPVVGLTYLGSTKTKE